ncbi:hypothetical protein ACFS7Z_01505 [Pontibacter toksunensis]|uniref:Uncharacterized protein n=1 Tax=Pontibacter toksunensis TaxID=1332631 RepID=A0ABW6BQ16_9BACT
MAGLQADNMHPEFLRNFISETVYLVDGDTFMPAPVSSAAVDETPQADKKPAPKPAPDKPKAEAHVRNLITEHSPVATPHIPKSPDAAAAVAHAAVRYKVAGANAKGIVVLVTLPDDEFDRLPQLQFLQKILAAIGLHPGDVAYVNNKTGTTALFEELQQAIHVNYIISFASRLETSLPHDKFTLYHPVMISDVPVVFSQALSILEKDTEHKKKLWGALQQVFL